MTWSYSAPIVWFFISYLMIFFPYSQCNRINNQEDQQTEWETLNQRFFDRISGKTRRVFVEKRNVPFGSIVGIASTNVPAYSNGNDQYTSWEDNKLYDVVTGMKWQCVEYARRWLFIRKGCIFEDVDMAYQMWSQLSYVERVVDGTHFPLKRCPNGYPTPPKKGSLLIYQRSQSVSTGHVAVIVDVLSDSVRVAEQNYYFRYWGSDYARQIALKFENGKYYISDDLVVYGWMEVSDNNQLKPLDSATIRIISAQG